MSLNPTTVLAALNVVASLAKNIVEITGVINSDMSDEQKRAFIQKQNDKQIQLMLELEKSLT